jgi:CHASE3 domain sensor protein
MPEKSTSVIRNLQIVFFISTVLLLVSLVSSLYSTKELVDSSKMVNHTNEVLIEAENLISYMKDAETGQRGYIITLDPVFLEPYKQAKINVNTSTQHLKSLTLDNPIQQQNIEEANVLIGKKMYQMEKIIGLNVSYTRKANTDTITRYNEVQEKRYFIEHALIGVRGFYNNRIGILLDALLFGY